MLFACSVGDRGLGFALTSRDVAANDGERLIYIKSITPGGVAFEDGRLKMGDRLLKVNDEDISGYTRPEVADLLRTCQGRITLTVSRQGGASSDDEEVCPEIMFLICMHVCILASIADSVEEFV